MNQNRKQGFTHKVDVVHRLKPMVLAIRSAFGIPAYDLTVESAHQLGQKLGETYKKVRRS